MRRTGRMWWRALLAAGVLAGTVGPGAIDVIGQTGVTVDPPTLLIDPGPGATVFSGVLRVESPVKVSVTILPRPLPRIAADPLATNVPSPTDLACVPAEPCIGSATVTPNPATLVLSPGVPGSVVVSIAAPLRPGIYAGTLDIFSVEVLEGSPAPNATVVPPVPVQQSVAVRLVVRNGDTLKLPDGVATITARRVRIESRADEILAGLFLSDAERSSEVFIPAANLGRDAVLLQPRVDAIGQGSGRPLPGSAVTWANDSVEPCAPTSQIAFPPGSAPAFRMCVDKTAVQPDRYTGTVTLLGSDGIVASRLGLDLTLKQGPGIPFALILLGIGLGMVAKWLIDRAFPGAALLDQLRRLRTRITDLPQGDQAPLEPLAASVRERLDADDQEGAKSQLTALAGVVATTEDLVNFEGRHPGQYAEQRAQIRRYLREGVHDAAATSLKDLKKTAAGGTITQPEAEDDGTGGVIFGPLGGTISLGNGLAIPRSLVILVLIVLAAQPFIDAFPLRIWVTVVGVAALAAGILFWRRQIGNFVTTHWLPAAGMLRPVVRVLLAFVLAVVGLETLYVADAAKVISAAIDPWVVFTFWGLGSDVASRTIVNFAKSG